MGSATVPTQPAPVPRTRRLRRLRRVLVRGLLGFVAAVALYIVGFWAVGLVPVNTGHVQPATGVAIWVLHRGVHVDFALPLRNEIHDWTSDISFSHFDELPSDPSYVIVGWGDRGFYLETPQWSDLRVSTALRALSYTGRTAVHVGLMPLPATNEHQRRIVLRPEQYRDLVAYVRGSFARDEEGRVQPIPGVHYHMDAFYEGVGAYGLFHTCNTWVNEGLRRIGVRTALWAVFGASVMRHLPLPD